MKKVILYVIKINRKLFYNTPIHHLRIVNFVYLKLFNAAYGKTETVVVNYEDCKFNVPTRDITMLPSMLNDNYEKREIKFIRQHLKPGSIFIDVGANVGLFTVIASKAVGSKGKVYAFEPVPENVDLLHENMKLNGVKNVRAEQLALGKEASTLKLHLIKDSVGTHSFLERSGTVENEIDVSVVSLDDYFSKIKGKIDLIKIDVEGFEPFVLEGAKKTLKRVDCLLFEYIQNDIKGVYPIDDFIDLFKDFPYVYGINERKLTIAPFSAANFRTTQYINIIASKKRLPKSEITD